MFAAMAIAPPGQSDRDGETGSFLLLQVVEASRCPPWGPLPVPSQKLFPGWIAARVREKGQGTQEGDPWGSMGLCCQDRCKCP